MIQPDENDGIKVRRELMFSIIRWTIFYAPPLCVLVALAAKKFLNQDLIGLLEALYAGLVTLCGTVISWYCHGANKGGAE